MHGNILPSWRLSPSPRTMIMNILSISTIQEPYLAVLIDKNDFVSVKYQHIVYAYLLAYPAIQLLLQLGKIKQFIYLSI